MNKLNQYPLDRATQIETDPALSQSLTVRELISQILSSGIDLDERVVINIAPWLKYSERIGTGAVSIEDGLLTLSTNGERFYGFHEDDDEDDDLD